MLKVRFSGQFKKDFKKVEKRGKDMSKLKKILTLLSNEDVLPPANKDHALTGDWKSFRECHIEHDWLLIYRINNDILELIAQRTGTHSELFNK